MHFQEFIESARVLCHVVLLVPSECSFETFRRLFVAALDDQTPSDVKVEDRLGLLHRQSVHELQCSLTKWRSVVCRLLSSRSFLAMNYKAQTNQMIE